MLYREIEFALPKELTNEQNITLAKEFTAHITGENKHPYTLALHRGKGENPHVHLLFSERVNDGITRIPAQWFKQWNKNHPEKGGARKADIGSRRDEWLTETREAWARMANEALEKAGQEARIDHRSYQEQGIDKIPGQHIGPNVIAMDQRRRKKGLFHELYMPRRLARILEVDQWRGKLEELKKEKAELEAQRERAIKEEEERARHHKVTQSPSLQQECLTVAPELETAVERIEGAYREEGAFGAPLRIPIKALGIPKQKIQEFGITKELTPKKLLKAWVQTVKEEARTQVEQLEKQKEAMHEQHLKELEASDRARPEKPPWYAPFRRRRYEREWEEWHQQGKKLRKEINERNRVMDERIRRIEKHPELVKKDAAKQYPVLAMLGSEAIKALERKRKQEEAEKAKRQAEEAKEQADRLRKAAQAPPPRGEGLEDEEQDRKRKRLRRKYAKDTVERLYEKWEKPERIMNRMLKEAREAEKRGQYGPDAVVDQHPERFGSSYGRGYGYFREKAEKRKSLIGAWLEDELQIPSNKRKYQDRVKDIIDRHFTLKQQLEQPAVQPTLAIEQKKKPRHKLSLGPPKPPKPW